MNSSGGVVDVDSCHLGRAYPREQPQVRLLPAALRLGTVRDDRPFTEAWPRKTVVPYRRRKPDRVTDAGRQQPRNPVGCCTTELGIRDSPERRAFARYWERFPEVRCRAGQPYRAAS